jgi:tRNA threonylcarbamoyl adenosine modification protein YeaZ
MFLALDTSTPRGSVAIGLPGDVLARVTLERQGGHAAELIPAVARVVEASGVELQELTGIVVGAGPGSFTGVRVAASTAKGLRHALGIPLWAFSSLAAAAATADALTAEAAGLPTAGATLPSASGLASFARCVLFDARGDRVYAACYRFAEGGPPRTLLEPRATTLGGILEEARALATDVAFAGDGAQRHQRPIQDAGFPLLGPPAGEPTADGLLHLLALDPDVAPLEDPGRWEPEYLRASNAERERNR